MLCYSQRLSPIATCIGEIMRKAFTLAEVLITLGIIGIVSALTIPNTIAKYQEKVRVNKLNNVYAKLLEAFRLMVNENGTIDTYGATNEKRIKNILELLPHYLNGIEKCNPTTLCTPSYHMRRNGKDKLTSGGYYYKMSDGSVISFSIDGGDCIQDMSLTKVSDELWSSGTAGKLGCGRLHIDLNGKSGPNVADKDYFLFKIVKDGIIPAGSSKEKYWAETFENQCMGKQLYYDGGYCAGWVIYNKNMDYLHNKDLSW